MERRNDDRIGCGPMTLALPVIAIMLACGITEIKQDAGSEPVLDELEFPDRTVCCVTGIEYPSGYDWMEDEATDEIKRSLVVFADAQTGRFACHACQFFQERMGNCTNIVGVEQFFLEFTQLQTQRILTVFRNLFYIARVFQRHQKPISTAFIYP